MTPTNRPSHREAAWEVYQENPRGRFIPCRHCPNVECTCFTELEQALLDKLTDTQKALEQDKARIEKLEAALQRLTKVGPPSRSCTGLEYAQVCLEDNCRIAIEALERP